MFYIYINNIKFDKMTTNKYSKEYLKIKHIKK